MRGYFEIGIVGGKNAHNLGTLWRTAYQLGASGIFVVGHRFYRMASDTVSAYKHIPMREYEDVESLLAAQPFDCQVVGVETDGENLNSFRHPERAIYVLGAEDYGLSKEARLRCRKTVRIESIRAESFNVAVAGAIIMYDRLQKMGGPNGQSKVR